MPRNYPALKMSMGTWDYYVVRMRMADVASSIKFAHEINQEKTLDTALQRVINKSRAGKLITNYLSSQPERFFNSLVVAAFNGNPTFFAVDITDDARFDMLRDELDDTFGVIRFSDKIETFALDGQHRLYGIKQLMNNESTENAAPPGFSDETISVVYVCPPSDVSREMFLKSYRRLFSSLNRHAKATDERTNIIMDEDDRFAIVTRKLLRENDFFRWSHEDDSPKIDAETANKNMPTGSNAFTNIVSFYHMNVTLLWDQYYAQEYKKKPNLIQLTPDENDVETLYLYLEKIWDALLNVLPVLKEDPVNMRKNGANGSDGKHDNLLFRPVVQLDLFAPLVRRLLDEADINEESSIEEMEKALKVLILIPWSGQHNLWRDFLSIRNHDGKWVMRNESRGACTKTAYSILLWLTGLEDLGEEQLDKLQEEWSALLDPMNVEREKETFPELEDIREKCIELRNE